MPRSDFDRRGNELARIFHIDVDKILDHVENYGPDFLYPNRVPGYFCICQSNQIPPKHVHRCPVTIVPEPALHTFNRTFPVGFPFRQQRVLPSIGNTGTPHKASKVKALGSVPYSIGANLSVRAPLILPKMENIVEIYVPLRLG